jgi:hypothetical protein
MVDREPKETAERQLTVERGEAERASSLHVPQSQLTVERGEAERASSLHVPQSQLTVERGASQITYRLFSMLPVAPLVEKPT